MAARSQTKKRPYGERIAESFGIEDAPSLAATIRGQQLSLTRVKSPPNWERTEALPEEDAFIFGLQFRTLPSVEFWMGDRLTSTVPMVAGTFSMVHLGLRPSARVASPLDSLHFYVTQQSLDGVADEQGTGRLVTLRHPPGISVPDPAMKALATSLLPTFEHQERVSDLFFSEVTLAFQIHVIRTYGLTQRSASDARGGLARWQERRAKEFIAAHLDGTVPVGRLAEECGLSRSHFVRAFKQNTGMPPHRWLSWCRVEDAKTRMRDPALSLAEVATLSGFAHQSHLTKVFTKLVGVTPGVWRRSYGRPVAKTPPDWRT